MTEPSRPDLSNWRDGAHSPWAFQHMDQVLPTEPISHGAGPAWPLQAAAADLEGFAVSFWGGEPLGLVQLLDETATDAFVVLKRGEIVFEHYGSEGAAMRPHILMSASKSVVGLAAAILEAAGLLDSSALVARYVPEVAEGPYASVTVRDLLDMRSGVAFDAEQQLGYFGATGWDPPPGGASAGLHAFFAGLKGEPATPGGPFAYVSANTDLLGWAMERAARRSFAALLSERLWVPMGAETDGLITLDGHGAPRTTGGVCVTARDLARLGRLLVEDGLRDGVQVAPQGFIETLERDGDREAWRTGEWGAVFAAIGKSMACRNDWYVVDDGPPYVFAMGIHGQNLFMDRRAGLVAVKLSSQPSPFDPRAVGLAHAAFRELQRLLA